MDIQDLLDEVEEAIQDRPSAGVKKAPSSSYSSSSFSSSTKSNYSSAREDESSHYHTSSSTSSYSRKKNVDDIDDILNMIDDEDGATAAPVHPRRTSFTNNSSSTASTYKSSSRAEEFQASGGSKKCSTLVVGGESAKRGLNTAFASHSVCANLRCNDCDFTVVQFLGKKWSTNADYMFFRENVPNEAKLRARMEPSPDSAAYACQCKWLSIDVPTRADMCRVKWSCAGH